MSDLIYTLGSDTIIEVAPYTEGAAAPADAAYEVMYVAEQFSLNPNQETEEKSQYGQGGRKVVIYKDRTWELDLSETDYNLEDEACAIVREAFLAKGLVYVRLFPAGKGAGKESYTAPARVEWSLKGENSGYLRTPVKFNYTQEPVRAVAAP